MHTNLDASMIIPMISDCIPQCNNQKACLKKIPSSPSRQRSIEVSRKKKRKIQKEVATCLVCYEPIKRASKMHHLRFRCGHGDEIHRKCMNQWVRTRLQQKMTPDCPFCRKTVRYNSLSRIFLWYLCAFQYMIHFYFGYSIKVLFLVIDCPEHRNKIFQFSRWSWSNKIWPWKKIQVDYIFSQNLEGDCICIFNYWTWAYNHILKWFEMILHSYGSH